MKTTVTQWAAKAAGAGAIALLLATPAVAQQRGDWNRSDDGRNAQQQQQATAYRDGGDRAYGSNDRAYGTNDNYRVRDDHRYERSVLRGVVERVDYRSGTIRLRDQASGRAITADVNSRELRNVRRGDRVELTGQWNRGGIFSADRLDNVRGRR